MNDIDLWNDICDCEENLEHSITKENKTFWKKEIKKLTKEFQEKYI